MPISETVFKPKYSGAMRFAFYLWPVWGVLFLFFVYRVATLRILNPDGILVLVFGIMTFSMPFRVFREMHFADRLIIKRYLLPDVVMEYPDIIEFNLLAIKTSSMQVSLYLMTTKSFEELEAIIHRLMSARKIRLKKKGE